MDHNEKMLKRKELMNLPLKFEVEEVEKVTNAGVCLLGTVLEGILLKDMKIKIGHTQLKTSVVEFISCLSIFHNGAKPFDRCFFQISNPELFSSIKKGDIVIEYK